MKPRRAIVLLLTLGLIALLVAVMLSTGGEEVRLSAIGTQKVSSESVAPQAAYQDVHAISGEVRRRPKVAPSHEPGTGGGGISVLVQSDSGVPMAGVLIEVYATINGKSEVTSSQTSDEDGWLSLFAPTADASRLRAPSGFTCTTLITRAGEKLGFAPRLQAGDEVVLTLRKIIYLTFDFLGPDGQEIPNARFLVLSSTPHNFLQKQDEQWEAFAGTWKLRFVEHAPYIADDLILRLDPSETKRHVVVNYREWPTISVKSQLSDPNDPRRFDALLREAHTNTLVRGWAFGGVRGKFDQVFGDLPPQRVTAGKEYEILIRDKWGEVLRHQLVAGRTRNSVHLPIPAAEYWTFRFFDGHGAPIRAELNVRPATTADFSVQLIRSASGESWSRRDLGNESFSGETTWSLPLSRMLGPDLPQELVAEVKSRLGNKVVSFRPAEEKTIDIYFSPPAQVTAYLAQPVPDDEAMPALQVTLIPVEGLGKALMLTPDRPKSAAGKEHLKNVVPGRYRVVVSQLVRYSPASSEFPEKLGEPSHLIWGRRGVSIAVDIDQYEVELSSHQVYEIEVSSVATYRLSVSDMREGPLDTLRVGTYSVKSTSKGLAEGRKVFSAESFPVGTHTFTGTRTVGGETITETMTITVNGDTDITWQPDEVDG